jgi:hypothetical protein
MTRKIDILNIGFIFISLTLAFLLPFELFIFSYVVLGPLHYLTEINWLRDRNYFVRKRRWTWLFILVCLLIAMAAIVKLPVINHYIGSSFTKSLSAINAGFYSQVILVMFLFAIGLVYFSRSLYIFLFLLGTVVAVILVNRYVSGTVILAGILLPTIIHIFLFTLLFMILGALNAGSKTGMLGAILLMICPLIIFFIPLDPARYTMAMSVRSSYMASTFSNLSEYLAKLFQPSGGGSFSLFSSAGIRIQIFIAFSYTYHYLNWFSKTSVIGWSKTLSKTKLLSVILIWICSLLLYWYDYRTGYLALFFLSLLHVMLEFPLNITSIKGIVSRVRFPAKKTWA